MVPAAYGRSMDVRALLTDGFDRITELYAELAVDLDEHALHHRPGGTGNPVGWLLWHVARGQDHQVAGLSGEPQVWARWQQRLGMEQGLDDIGYGHTSAEVDAVRIEDPALLAAYHREVAAATADYLARVDDGELDRVVDEHWDPPVTAGVRLISIQGDCLQHLGQVAYVRGLLDR
jgi:DinB superfamily